jgi:hypothetical protein
MVKIKRLNENNNDDSCRLLNSGEYDIWINKKYLPFKKSERIIIKEQYDKIHNIINEIIEEDSDGSDGIITIENIVVSLSVYKLEDYYFLALIEMNNDMFEYLCDTEDGLKLLSEKVIPTWKSYYK